MRTITKTFKIYNFDELSDKAKENAINHYRESMQFGWQDEIINTIEKIAEAMSCDYNYYSYDGITYDVSFTPNGFDEEIEGARAWAFIENNFITPNEKAKIYYLNHIIYCDGRKNWSRKSKINFNLSDCPFTGYCADCCFFEAWQEWKKNFSIAKGHRRGSNINDFIELVAEKLSSEWTQDNEYQYSDEGITEVFEANEYEFLEDGTIY